MDARERGGERMPGPVIREMRELRRQGYTRYHISLIFDTGTAVVTRYVKDIKVERPPQLKPHEREALLRQWRRPCV